MTRSQRLDPLLRVVQQRQDDAARVVGERERAQAEQEARLEALRRYAEEYSAAPASPSNSMRPSHSRPAWSTARASMRRSNGRA